MKANIRKLFNRIVALLLAVLISSGVPITAFAESNSLDSEIKANDTLVELENAVSSGEGSYSYTAPDEGSFLIESVTGTMSITNGIPVVNFDDYTVAIPTFDYYKVVDQSGNVRFYQADVSKDPTQTSNIAYIAIYVDNGHTYSLHVQYMAETQDKMYNIIVSLTEDQFHYFDQISTVLCLGTDDVSQRLKSSGRVYTHGTFENCDSNENNSTYNTVMPAALNSVAANSYDEYTNSDGIIMNYVDDYFGEYLLDDGYTVTDDPIVNIVPKELFFIVGEHVYVGKEYGFYIRVVVDAIDTRDYAADVMVFNITHTAPSFAEDGVGVAKVEPLFQYKYRATEGYAIDIDPSLSCVVIPHALSDYITYYLKDVGFRITMDNPTALNPGDNGYDPYKDEGAFFIQTRLNVSGIRLQGATANFAVDTALFAGGFVPVLGTAISVVAYTGEVFNGWVNEDYFVNREVEVSNNEANINTLMRNNTDQIAEYGQLIKTQEVTLSTDSNNPRLIHTGGGYMEVRYEIARKSDSSYNKIRVISSIKVNVVEEEVSLNTGQSTGNVVSRCSATGTYETGDYKRLNDVSLSGSATVAVPASSQRYTIKITPKVSGSYKIFTGGSNGDPNFYITNATKGTSQIAATDDINGASNRNAVLTLDLIGGDIYYLEAFRYGTPYTYTLRMGYNPVSSQGLTENVPYSVTTASDSYQMLEITASTSGYYQFATSGASSDPQIFLFDSYGHLLDSDDDSGGNRNALLEYELVAGTTYYLAVQGYNGNAATFTITVSSPN